MFSVSLQKLIKSPTIFTPDSLKDAFELLLTTEPSSSHSVQVAAFLTALRVHGLDQHPAYIATAAHVLREHSLKVDFEPAVLDQLVDIVGTGGDGWDTFNVSTTSAMVAAGAGCKVAKHGNRASTSSSGSADMLEALGCKLNELSAQDIPDFLTRTNFVFLFAPMHHPLLKNLAPIRKSLPFPTLFNLLGPLVNPAGPKRMVVGVRAAIFGKVFVEALSLGGVEHALVVCGREGLDEISPSGPTDVWELKGKDVLQYEISPEDFGLDRHPLSTVRGGDSKANAEILRRIMFADFLENDRIWSESDAPIVDFVLLNTAALLKVAGKAATWSEGVELARNSLKSRQAWQQLVNFRDFQNSRE